MTCLKAWKPRLLYALIIGCLLTLIASTCIAATTGQGHLTIIEPDGKSGEQCPLEHTSVKVAISGFIARVEVKQIFHNARQEKIEAIYTFPLSSNGAVDQMLMKVGDKEIRGEIKRREEARQIYQAARDQGRLASMLDQERPNIFTQSVANIMPGQKVEITIGYIETLNYEEGAFQFVFPMVVAPRFIPGLGTGSQGTGWAQDTSQVPDAGRITPPVAEEGTRAGHDIDLSVSIDAGVPIENIKSSLHEVDIDRKNGNEATVTLRNKKEIPNRDFVLEYTTAADKIKSGYICHKDGENGYVMVVMIPPKRITPEQVAPRELIFIIDISGSQQGPPLEKSKETVKYMIKRMNPNDTFNIIDFNDTTRALFSVPKKNTPETTERALQYVQSLRASGGTRMTSAIWEALSSRPAENRLRVVTFMTDGLVGNDFEVIQMVKKLHDKSRWFSFGAGNSVNRFLLDNVARAGGGEVDYILLNSSSEDVARKFNQRMDSPILTDISIKSEGVTLEEIFPSTVSDLWSHKPLIFKARYTKPGSGTIKIEGFQAGQPYEQELKVNLPDAESANSAVSTLWARSKVDELVDQDLMGIQRGNPDEQVKEEIVKVALAHRIMTQFTSFVAVEDTIVTMDGKPVKVTIPVELAEGVSREGVFGPGSTHLLRKSRPTGGVPTATSRGVAGYTGGSTGFGMAASPAPRTGYKRQITSVNEERQVQDSEVSKFSKELKELLAMQDTPLNYTKGKVVVKDGQLTVQVWLNRSTDEIIKNLEEKGFKIKFRASTGKMIVGVISLSQLADLEKIPDVIFVEPFSTEG